MTPEFWGFTPRDAVFLLVFVFGMGRIYQRIVNVEQKIGSFITKEVIAEKEKAADREHEAIRGDVTDVAHRVAALERGAMG